MIPDKIDIKYLLLSAFYESNTYAAPSIIVIHIIKMCVHYK